MKAGPKTESLELTREIAAPPERVFRALTNPEDLAKWWTGDVGGISRATFDLRPGGSYRLEFSMSKGMLAVVHGVVKEVDPPKRLVMTWFSPDHPKQETLLSFELEPIKKGTRLRLSHTGFTEPGSRDDHEHGWIEALTLLLSWITVAGPMFAAGARGTKET